MECNNPKVRKKLRDYAANTIVDNALIKEMDAHIETCPVCKRELYMWQEVLMNQAVLTNNMAEASLRARVKQHMRVVNKDPNLPRFIKKMDNIGKVFLSRKGCIVTQLIMITLMAIWIFLLYRKDINPAVPILIVISFVSMFVLLFKKR